MVYMLVGFGVLLIGALWVFAWRMRRAGEDGMSAKVTAATVDVLRKQSTAAAEAPKTKDELIDRLRKGGL